MSQHEPTLRGLIAPIRPRPPIPRQGGQTMLPGRPPDRPPGWLRAAREGQDGPPGNQTYSKFRATSGAAG